MRLTVPLLIAAVALGGARAARSIASRASAGELGEPYVPSEGAAPFLALGYREAAADLLFVRMLGYFGSEQSDASLIASLAEAITRLDPDFERAYDVGPLAISAAKRNVGNSVHLRAIALLKRAANQFPTAYRYPNLAGQIYLVDLKTNDPAQRREWDEKGALLLESAARKPGAPAGAAMEAAVLQTRFGQRQRAIAQLREILLITSDESARKQIVQKLSDLAGDDSEAIAIELSDARNRFVQAWQRERPILPATMYILIGPRLSPGVDLGELATGDGLVAGASWLGPIQPSDGTVEP